MLIGADYSYSPDNTFKEYLYTCVCIEGDKVKSISQGIVYCRLEKHFLQLLAQWSNKHLTTAPHGLSYFYCPIRNKV